MKKIPLPNTGSIKTVLEQLSATDPKARTANPQDFIDTSVVQELDQQGFFKQIWR